MELRNRATGAVITDSQFRAENRNTSFPRILPAALINSFGYDPVLEGPQATTVPPYEYSQRDGVVQINGQWFTRYVAGPVFRDYTDNQGVVHTAAAQYEAYRLAKDAEIANAIRANANYPAFWDALIASTVYASIRTQSMASLPMNTLATEFIALLGDAKAGRANEAAIQASMSAVFATGTFTTADAEEFTAALAVGLLTDIYSLT